MLKVRVPAWKSASKFTLLLAIAAASVPLGCSSDSNSSGVMGSARLKASDSGALDPTLARIRDEGLNHSQVMDHLDYLCNVIGERLTGSPSARRASEWTRDKLASWGLNAHLEEWGPFGRGWAVQRYSLQVVKPYTIVLTGYPRAWSPGFDKPFEAQAIHLDAKNEDELEQYRGKLKGQIVLIGGTKAVAAHFEPQALRTDDERLNKLASATVNQPVGAINPRPGAATAPSTAPSATPTTGGELLTVGSTTGPSTRGSSGAGAIVGVRFIERLVGFANEEGAALVIGPSSQGDGGTLYVAGATVPPEEGERPTRRRSTTRAASASAPTTTATTRPRAWAVDVPKIPPQITVTTEDFNRLLSMIKHGESLSMAVDLQVKFYDDQPTFNTIAEIPGTDLKDEVVMVGGHLDSWHSGTGATDNGAGAAASMEAVRIIKALNLKPRRTIRIGLWTGEEEGLLGSAAYVKKHFGYVPDKTDAATRPATQMTDGTEPDGGKFNPVTRPVTKPSGVIRGAEYETLSVYFNLDNGAGKIRGIYAQSSPAAAGVFHEWLRPFVDLGADTITLANTGSTDHICFDRIGLPGFQFIQDPLEYWTRTHHSNADVYDRLQPDDMKQAATIMAGFLWEAANADQRFPRKPMQ